MKLLNLIRQKYRDAGIRTKMIVEVFTVIILLIVINVTVFTVWFIKRNRDAERSYAGMTVQSAAASMESYLEDIETIAIDFNYNYNLQNYLIGKRNNTRKALARDRARNMEEYEIVSSTFRDILDSRTDVTAITIYGTDRILINQSVYTMSQSASDFSEFAWYRNAVENPDNYYLTGPNAHSLLMGNTDEAVSLYKALWDYQDGSLLGVTMIDLNFNQISSVLNAINAGQKESIAIVNENGNLVAQRDVQGGTEIDKAFLSKIRGRLQEGQSSFSITEGGLSYLVVTGEIGTTGWKVVWAEQESPFESVSREFLFPVLIIIGVILLALFVILTLLSRQIVAPITTLQKQMKSVNLDQPGVSLPVTRKDEIGDLTASFNEMTGRIGKLKEQLIQEEKEKRTYELKSLQAQINPHFLYNTLDSIIWMAEMNDPDVVPMTEALAKMMRLALSRGKSHITIEEEMEHVRNYLVIQSMRYQGKFDYQILVDEDVKSFMTIKLIVQPFVENSIYHGIKEKRGRSHLLVHVYREGQDVLILVRDDGTGMSEEEQATVFDKNRKPSGGGSGIGARNVNDRLKLSFGEDYGVTYKSVPGCGTDVLIRIPQIKAEDIEDESE